MSLEHRGNSAVEQERNWEKEYWQLAEQLKQLTLLNQSLAQQLDDMALKYAELSAKDEARLSKRRERVARHRERRINAGQNEQNAAQEADQN